MSEPTPRPPAPVDPGLCAADRAQPSHVESRPGLTAPHVQGGTIPTIPDDAGSILDASRSLFRTARHPYADAMWPHLRPKLLILESRLERFVPDDTDYDEAAVMLQEVRRYLRRTPR